MNNWCSLDKSRASTSSTALRIMNLLSHTHRVEWLRTDISYEEYRDAFTANGKKPALGAADCLECKSICRRNHSTTGGNCGNDDDVSALVDDGSDADKGLRFRLESDLEDALKTNLQQLEPGLVLSGAQQRVAAGRLDIAAIDSEDRNIVVIELKAGTAQPDSVPNCLRIWGQLIIPRADPSGASWWPTTLISGLSMLPRRFRTLTLFVLLHVLFQRRWEG